MEEHATSKDYDEMVEIETLSRVPWHDRGFSNVIIGESLNE